MPPLISTRSTLADALGGWPPPVFMPAGPYAGSVSLLALALLAIMAAVFLVVLVALWMAIKGTPQAKQRLGGARAIWLGGVAFPAVVLTGLLIWSLALTSRLSATPADAMRIRVTGEMWWFRVAYLDAAGRIAHEDANEIHIPAGRPVVLELESNDVIHNFWAPRLSGKRDMVPGRRNLLTIQADRAGVYGGQCAEYCGGPHALMGFTVVAHEAGDWARWQASRAVPPAPIPATVARGRQLFAQAGCAACHRVAGTEANGVAGPDLSHMGSRRTVGAGILPNHTGTLTGWIANSQNIKPNNRMPNYDMLPAADIAAIAAYLETRR